MPARQALMVIGEILVSKMEINLTVATGNHSADAAKWIFLFILYKNGLEFLAPLVNKLQCAGKNIFSFFASAVLPMTKKKSSLRVLGDCTNTFPSKSAIVSIFSTFCPS